MQKHRIYLCLLEGGAKKQDLLLCCLENNKQIPGQQPKPTTEWAEGKEPQEEHRHLASSLVRNTGQGQGEPNLKTTCKKQNF